MCDPSRHSGWTGTRTAGSSSVSIAESSNAAELLPAPLLRKTNDETFQSTCKKHRNVIIVSVISHVIFILIIFILIVRLLYCQERSVPSNHQQDVIKCPPDTCPDDWIAHLGYCYKLSEDEKNWTESQNFCTLHNATLAKITGEEEKDFVRRIAGNHVVWIGLRKESNHPWKWLDGENATLEVLGNGGDCAYLNDDKTASSGSCSNEHCYICKKKI